MKCSTAFTWLQLVRSLNLLNIKAENTTGGEQQSESNYLLAHCWKWTANPSQITYQHTAGSEQQIRVKLPTSTTHSHLRPQIYSGHNGQYDSITLAESVEYIYFLMFQGNRLHRACIKRYQRHGHTVFPTRIYAGVFD